MRVLLVTARHGEHCATARALEGAGCRLETVGSEREAFGAMSREPPDVVIVWVSGDASAETIARLRTAVGGGQSYVLAMLEGPPRHWDIPTILAGGANDVVRCPVTEAEVVARVTGSRGAVRRPPPVVAPLLDRAGVGAVGELRAWRDAGALVAHELGHLVGEELRATLAPPGGDGRDRRGATISMSLARAQVEVQLSLVTTSPGLHRLGTKLLADPSPKEAALDDVLRELANVAGGAVKRAALSESVTLTTGLPFDNPSVRVEGHGIRFWTLTREDGTECVAVAGEIQAMQKQRVPAASLREGMVLTQDLRTESGLLLVTSGSRLTNTTASRLAKLLGSRILVDVLCST
jgi:CheY-like chemotaxis protein